MGGGSELQRLNSVENLQLGLAAGCLCKMINYPLLNWKNTVQQSLPISFKPQVVYRGLPMATFNLGSTTPVQFWACGYFQKALSGGKEGKLSADKELLAAFLGGFLSGIPCSVWELTMVQQQRFGGSIFETPTRIVKEFGVTGLSRGLSMTAGRESLYTMAMLGVTPVIQHELTTSHGVENSTALASGALLGAFVSVTLTHPLDTIKTCMQGDISRLKYTNVIGTFRSLVKEYGIARGLFKGISWRMALISTTFFLVNKLKESLAPVMFASKFS